ncbi:hypothetical protein BC827DRAFT_1269740 [Russula dissimulans]|nr:hypothetical protein BC827DRAFT_1269740 [Russula dissimulans]
MSTVIPAISSSGSVISLENLLFDYPEADIILRSRDSYEFRVLKLYIVHSSPVLCDEVLISPNPPPSTPAIPVDSQVEGSTSADALQVVDLPLNGAILFSLLTYIFPVPPVLPSTVEQTMELLSVAQKYKMDVVLTHIRNQTAQQDPPFIRRDTAFLIYSLAQKYGLRHEALKAARSTLSFSTLTIQNLHWKNKLSMMPGDVLHELWKYHQRVRSNLTSDLEEFRKSNVPTILDNSSCGALTESGIPTWIDRYITSIGTTPVPAFVNPTAFHMNETIDEFWEALSVVVHGSITKAEPDLALVDGTRSESQAGSPSSNAPSQPKYSDMSNADVILQSSDLINFHVHRSALAAASPFFRDMFSLPQPQPSSDESLDGLPIVHSPEDAEVLNSLISMLYSVPPEIPDSHDSILALLAAAQKYEMDTVLSSIRAEISRRELLSPTGSEAFRVYAVACSKRLIPEMESTARLTLAYPMTFESLGEAMRSFEGCALHDLTDFHWRCKIALSGHFHSLSLVRYRRSSSRIWVGCPTVRPPMSERDESRLPTWLESLFLRKSTQQDRFTQAIPKADKLGEEYLEALQAHVNETDCHFCMKVHTLKGEAFCMEIKRGLNLVQNISYEKGAKQWRGPLWIPSSRRLVS